MSLRQRLDSFRDRFMAEAEPDVAGALLQADAALGASGIARQALKAGDRAPDFRLPDARGRMVALSAQLRSGPAVVSFYRGDWCPYCRLELRALAERHGEIERLGATLLAISPQRPGPDADGARLPFATLSDRGSRVGRAYGVTFEVPASIRPVYARFGHPLPRMNGTGDWLLPLPATYVVDRRARIVLSFVDADYRRRLEPDAIVAALKGLVARGRG